MTEGIELNAEVHILRREGDLVDVEGMGMLVSGHALVNDKIQIDRRSTDVDGNEGSRGERPAQAGGPQRSVGPGSA